jgi:segregation and condensation protein A
MPEGQDATVPPAPALADESTPGGDLGVTVALEQFNGPMDLLLYLVRRAEVDIKDLPVLTIADQFASWVAAAAGTTLDLEAAGDFVVMAATLLEIKARLVAPPPQGTEVADDGEDDFDPRAGLIRKLLIYRAAKEAAFDLDRREDQRRLRHHRGHREMVPDDAAEIDAWELKDVGAGTLANMWFDLLKRIDGLGPRTVAIDDVPMGVRMAQMVEDMRQRGEGLLSQLFAIDSGPVARVGIVMAVLECTRQRLLRVGQAEQYGDVLIRFRPEDDRAIGVGDPGPPEQLPKRQRRPPLVTWTGTVAPEGDEPELAAEDPALENEEQRFLRELESSVGVERMLARSANLETGFIDWWEETHPGEALPQGVVRPAPPPPPPPPAPEPKVEAPAKPKRAPKAVPAEPVPAALSVVVPAEPATVAVVTAQPKPPVQPIPDPAPSIAMPQSPAAGSEQGGPGDAEPALVAAIPDPSPLAAVAPPLPLAELELGAPGNATPLTASGPSFEIVPLAEAVPDPAAEAAGPWASARVEPDGIAEAVSAPDVSELLVEAVAEPLAAGEPRAEAHAPEQQAEAAAEPLPEAHAPAEPPPPDPVPPPPPETANTPAIPATTPSPISKPTPMSRPRHLKTAALAALWVLSTVALVAWFQRPAQVLTASGPNDVVVARDEALAWTLNLALDPKDPEAWLLPTASQPGTFSWRDAHTCVFTPAGALPPGAELAVAFPPNLRAYGGFRFSEKDVPAFSVRTLPSLSVGGASASVPAFTDGHLDLALNRVPADANALCAAVTVSPALVLSKAVVDGRLRLSGAFVPGTSYTVTVADTTSGRADDRPSAWQAVVAMPAREPGARLAAGVGRQAVIEAVNLTQIMLENATGGRDILRFAPAVGDQPARAELPAWLLASGENRLLLRWAGGAAEITLVRHDLHLTPDDGAPALLGGTLPVISAR